MQVYFLAERECVLRVNGIHLGIIDLFERSCELTPEDGVTCELIPFDGFLPVSFRFDESFLLQPPPQVQLYYTKNAVAVYCHAFLPSDQTLRVIWQEHFGDALLTLAVQGKVQLYLQTEQAHIIDLPWAMESCKASLIGDRFLLASDTAFALIGRDGEVLILSEGRVLSADQTLKAEIPFRDCLGHTALCEWENGKLTSCTIRTQREPTSATTALALFESVLIGADATPFLSEELAKKATDLKEYLGEFISVVLTDDPECVGLVFVRRERIFDVRYYTVELEQGKVSNILPCE